jgi:arylsulfatase A-like enzyme
LALALQTRPDVLIIVLDDVATKDMGLYVPSGVDAPYIEGLAAQGVRFTSAYANPFCSPSRRSLNTGRWWITGNGRVCFPPEANTPPLSEVFLPEALPGYASAFFGKWHIGGNQTGGAWECAPLTQGYAYWYEGQPGNVDECGGNDYNDWLEVNATPSGCTSQLQKLYEPFLVADKFVHGWTLATQPRLAVVNINLPHGPYHRPPSWLLPTGYPLTPTQRAKYEAMIRAYDELIGYMLTVVDLASTQVWVIGDNGTPGGVVGGFEQNRAKGTTFERGVKVPLIVAGAGVTNGGRDANDLVHIADIFATCVEEARGTAVADGVSLMPILDDVPHFAPHDFVLLGTAWGTPDGDRASLSADGYKLRQLDTDGDTIPDGEQFYDLNANPGESVNLIADPGQATRVAAHRAWIQAHSP